MKYIPGTTIITHKGAISGSIKKFFKPSTSYYIKNITRQTDHVVYTFQSVEGEFTINQPTFTHGDLMIDYLKTGNLTPQSQSYWDRDRKD